MFSNWLSGRSTLGGIYESVRHHILFVVHVNPKNYLITYRRCKVEKREKGTERTGEEESGSAKQEDFYLV